MAKGTSDSLARLGTLLDRAIVTFGSVPSWVRLRDEVAARLNPPRPPVIGTATQSSCSGRVGVEIHLPLLLTSGDKPIRWLIESVSSEEVAPQLRLSAGLLSGWTPSIEDSGVSVQVVVAAENVAGRDTKEITIQVAETEPVVITEVAPSLLPVDMGQLRDDRYRPGDRVVVEALPSGWDGPMVGTVVTLSEPPLPPRYRWVLLDSPEGQLSILSIREASLHLLSRLNLGDTVEVLPGRQLRLQKLSTVATASASDTGARTTAEITHHAGNQCVVGLDQGHEMHCFTDALVAAQPSFLYPGQCSYLGYADYVMRSLIPGMRVAALGDPSQTGAAWARERRSFNVTWDDGSTDKVAAGQLLVLG